MPKLGQMPLFWRVFATNAAVLVLAAVALVATPATVSFPVALAEAVVLAVGLGGLMLVNLVLLRRVFRPLRRLSDLMRDVDPLRPGTRAALEDADPELAELVQSFNDMVDRLETERRESGRRALEAQESERLRVARDLHDEVGQRLTAVMLRLRDDPEAREEVRAAIEEVRAIGHRLRPEALDLGLAAALRSLATGLEAQTSLRIHRDIAPQAQLTEEQEGVAYRIAQEALTNAIRHSGAREIRVELKPATGGTLVAVEDNGVGLNGAADGTGIRGMRERAMLVGAELAIRSREGAGTRVELMLPARG